jgi:hypothetical protein
VFVNERNVCNTLLSLLGYWYINPCPVPWICTSQEPGIFCTIIRELAAGTATSSVPVKTKVGTDIFEIWPQTPLQFVANQLSTILNCFFNVPGEIVSLGCGIVKLGWDLKVYWMNIEKSTDQALRHLILLIVFL